MRFFKKKEKSIEDYEQLKRAKTLQQNQIIREITELDNNVERLLSEGRKEKSIDKRKIIALKIRRLQDEIKANTSRVTIIDRELSAINSARLSLKDIQDSKNRIDTSEITYIVSEATDTKVKFQEEINMTLEDIELAQNEYEDASPDTREKDELDLIMSQFEMDAEVEETSVPEEQEVEDKSEILEKENL